MCVANSRSAVRRLLFLRCQPPEGSFAGVETATIVQEEVQQQQDVLAECQTLLQQQLPADSSLQQLLEPLLPAAEAGGAAAAAAAGAPGLSTGMPGEDVATIAADSTSLTVNVPRPASPEAMAAAVAMAAAAAASVQQPQQQPILDVEAREVPRSWTQAAAVQKPLTPQQQRLAKAPTFPVQQQQQAEQQRQDFKHWARVVGVCGFAALLCYLDRTNISTAIVPMAEQYGWNKQFCSIVMSAFFAGYGATQ